MALATGALRNHWLDKPVASAEAAQTTTALAWALPLRKRRRCGAEDPFQRSDPLRTTGQAATGAGASAATAFSWANTSSANAR